MNRALPIVLGTIAITLITFSGPANAVFVTANQLLTWCQSKNHNDQATCLGYLFALDSYLQFAPEASKSRVCVPAQTSGDELKNLVVMVLRSIRHLQGENASALVIEALASAFPCPSSVKVENH